MSSVKVYFDGASRNNPGPAGAGVLIKKNDEILGKYYRYLGKKTNNEAEYWAVIVGLKGLKRLDIGNKKVGFIGDSELIVNQLSGKYKIKEDRLKKLYWQIREEIINQGLSVTFHHVKREKNKEADKLANKAIDEKKKQIKKAAESKSNSE